MQDRLLLNCEIKAVSYRLFADTVSDVKQVLEAAARGHVDDEAVLARSHQSCRIHRTDVVVPASNTKGLKGKHGPKR